MRKEKIPPKYIEITLAEQKEYDSFHHLRHCDEEKGENTWSEYHARNKVWSAKIREKYGVMEKQSFICRVKKP